jgi:hypothetical protein
MPSRETWHSVARGVNKSPARALLRGLGAPETNKANEPHGDGAAQNEAPYTLA